MSACLPKSKHVKLTLACYPKSKSAAAKPNSSELQYLTYYAASRPKKLIKVGSFIKQKNVISALTEKCHHNLNLFVADVVDILQAVLHSNDATLIEHTNICFGALCKHYDGSGIGTTGSLTMKYEDLLRSYGALVVDNPALEVIGIQALYRASKSRAFETSHQTSQSSIILTIALNSLSDVRVETLYQIRQSLQQQSAASLLENAHKASEPKSRPSTGSRTASEYMDVISQNLVISYSLEILRNILTTDDAVRIRFATKQILRPSQQSFSSSNTSRVCSLIQIAAEWVSIDLRFHVLEACLGQLHKIDTKESAPTNFQFHILEVIRSLLSSRVSLVGLSFNDVLDGMFDIAAKLLKSSQSTAAELSYQSLEDQDCQSIETRFLQRLSAAIAALTAHSYYKGQGTDIFRNLMQRLGRSVAPSQSEPLSYRYLQLYTAKLVLIRSTSKSEPSDASLISPNAFVPGLGLLQEEPAVSMLFMELILTYLTVHCADGTSHHFDPRATAETSRTFQSVFYTYLCDNAAAEQEFQSALIVLQNLYRALPGFQALAFISMLHRVDEKCLENSLYATASNRTKLIDTLHLIAEGSGCKLSNLDSGASYGSRTKMPDIDLLLDTLPSELRSKDDPDSLERIASVSEHVQIYAAANNSSVTSKQSHRNRLASGLSGTRGEVSHGEEDSFKTPEDGSLINSLKKTLLQPFEERTSTERMESAAKIDDLFAGIEMQSFPSTKRPIELPLDAPVQTGLPVLSQSMQSSLHLPVENKLGVAIA